ncbi:hypothetical protein BJV74DRAFT_123610 [Russula compacta]|nr:hypothetical protein BJV74DRAFT_123610 [Russula compacta]
MNNGPESSRFRLLLEVALQDYEKQTGTRLADHYLARQLETCDSVESITTILQEQAQAFHEFRGDDGKVMKSLKCAVHVLYTLSTSTALGEGIGLPFPPAKAIFAGFAILLSAVKDVSASYDALIDLLESIEGCLNRLDIYTKVPPTTIMAEIIVKIIVELLSTLAVTTKQIKQGRPMKFVKKLFGENKIEAILQRLDRLTLDEARATAAQSLEAVYGLVQSMRVIVDDGNTLAEDVRNALEMMNQLRRDKLQHDVRKWLSPPDPWKNHNIAREAQHVGTTTWFTQGKMFLEWKSSGSSSLLWIHGKPGAGKSVLCSAIIQDIRRMRKLGLASLGFFYCDFRDNQKKDRRGLLSSLLIQFCDQADSYCAVLSDFYSVHDSGSQHPSDDELVQCLENMLKPPEQLPVFIVLDALDECSNSTSIPSPRDKILELVEELVRLRLPNLHICVTSRPEVDIKPVLSRLASHSISLHGESGQRQDILEYVRSVVTTDPMMRRWKRADKELVIDVLTKRADGM